MLARNPMDPATDEDALEQLCPQWCKYLHRPMTVPFCMAWETPLKRTPDSYILRCDECLKSDLID